MSTDPGIGTAYSSRNFSKFFRRWGSLGANIRSVWNTVIPVAIVDRFRGEDEGSIWALWAETDSTTIGIPAGGYPSIILGSEDPGTEIEILGFNAWVSYPSGYTGALYNSFFHCFTPVSPYDPITHQAPVGAYRPGLLLDDRFTRSSSLAIAGYAAALPAYPGWPGWVLEARYKANPGTAYVNGRVPVCIATSNGQMEQPFAQLRRPLTIPPQRTMAWQYETPDPVNNMDLQMSILFRERHETPLGGQRT